MISWYMYYIKVLVVLFNEDINQYVIWVVEVLEQWVVQSYWELCFISMFILFFVLLVLVIIGCVGWYIYCNFGLNLIVILWVMLWLVQGELNVLVLVLQWCDELGELVWVFNVFVCNMVLLEYIIWLLKEKINQMEIDWIKCQELEEVLLYSQKMKVVGQLIGGLVYDFNNLLVVIIGSFELVELDVCDVLCFFRVLKVVECGVFLIQWLLVFLCKQVLYFQVVVMVLLLENFSELMCYFLLVILSLEIEVQLLVWLVWIDVGQLENVLINLVMNVCDVMVGCDGVIKICIWNQWVICSSGQWQDMVVLEVIDYGSGMLQVVKVWVFELFFIIKVIGSGSGLGLLMVYGFVCQFGGWVVLESVLGQGMMVWLQLL